MNRKQAIKTIAATAGSAITLSTLTNAMKPAKPFALNGNINHSVCQWCYSSIPLEELARAAKEIGLKSVELLKPEDLRRGGLNSAALILISARSMLEAQWYRKEFAESLLHNDRCLSAPGYLMTWEDVFDATAA